MNQQRIIINQQKLVILSVAIEYESNGDKDKILSIEEYLDKIEPYLNNLIDGHKTQGEQKIQLTKVINFISSKDSDKIRTMNTENDTIEIMIGNETDEIIEELFKFLLQRYLKSLEESMKGSEMLGKEIILYYKLHKVSLNCIGSYIDSPKWLKNKKVTINPKK